MNLVGLRGKIYYMVDVNESLFNGKGNVGPSVVKRSKSLPSLKGRKYKTFFKSVSNLYIVMNTVLLWNIANFEIIPRCSILMFYIKDSVLSLDCQSMNAVYASSGSLFWDFYGTHKYRMWTQCRRNWIQQLNRMSLKKLPRIIKNCRSKRQNEPEETTEEASECVRTERVSKRPNCMMVRC